jgi:CHAT domain-containing protein/tetratricopeptide (TPR) repeat protein
MSLRRAAVSLATVVTLFASHPSFAAPPAKKPAAPVTAKDAIPAEADALVQRAIAAAKAGKFPDAVDLLQQALTLIEKKLGPDHYLLGFTLNLLTQIETIQGHLDIAEKHAERAIKVLKKDVNADPLRLGHALIHRAEIYGARGDVEAEIEYRKYAILLFEKAFGVEGSDAMAEILALARALAKYGRYDEAQGYYKHWIKVVEKRFGAYEPVLVETLLDYAISEMHAGRYEQAQALLDQALEIRKREGKVSDKDVAVILNNMAEVAYQRGDYAKAEALYERVLAVYENDPAAHPRQIGRVIGNLGSVRLDRGDSAEALPLLLRSLEIQEKHFGSDDPELVTPLTNVGEALLRIGRLDECIPYLVKALALREKALGPKHPRLVPPLVNLGAARLDQGNIPEAEVYFMRALSIQEQSVGPNHPLLFNILQAIGILQQEKKEFDRAEKSHLRAIEVLEKAFGPMHPDIVAPLKSMAVLHMRKADKVGARKDLLRAGEIAERQTNLMLAGGSEKEKLAWLSTLEPLWTLTVEHHLRNEPNEREAARLALDATLRRKGRALDAVAGSMSALRRRLSPEDQEVYNKLREAQKKLAALTMRGAAGGDPNAYRAALEDLQKEVQKLDDAVGDRSATYRIENRRATVDTVQAMLPKDAVYVEMIRHKLGWFMKPGEKAKIQYSAYILEADGEPQAVELGEAEEIDQAVMKLRAALSEPTRKDAKELARALDEKIMRPIRAKLGSSRRVILAPDGTLDFVPFEALVDESGHFLIENYSFSYVTSGRDMLRWSHHVPSRSGPLVLANPEFGEIIKRSKEEKASSRGDTTGISRVGFTPLSGTAEEGQAIVKQISGAALFSEKKATKASLTSAAGPKILHIATHGFFLGDTISESAGTGKIEMTPPALRAVEVSAPSKASPLLRSGLALSGANARGERRAEGILTALEASGLDLEGTKLVVLSACETGLGQARDGEGVQGLRRAFVLAGAETMVMSLWKVDDSATRDMMIGYYQRLDKGEARSEALRQVRLGMLANETTAHPYYWASFIVAGDPSRFDGTMPKEVPQVWRGKRGCACSVAGDFAGDDYGSAGFLLFVGGALLAWRKRSGRSCDSVRSS